MEIVDATKFWIAAAFAVAGLALLWTGRGTRGFGQRKQAGALLLVGAVVLGAAGLGLVAL